MGKPEQVLIIQPQNELRFRGPFTGSALTSYIHLTNPTKHKVYFKIKTTAPKRYCVRPNCGSIEPTGAAQIAVTLQPFEFDPTEKIKHKFMVQALEAPLGGDHQDCSNVWKYTSADELMESKLKCVFENPVSDTNITETVTKPEIDTNSGKTQGNEASVQLMPGIVDDTQEKLIKAAEEVNQLRVEESTLRQENLQLKEDLLKLQMAAVGNDSTLVSARGLTSQSSSQLPASSTNVLIAVVMVILGYLLGKMF